jgi:group II intron reverse transcriptase/maturase
MEPLEGKMTKSPNLDLVSTKRRRIAELAGQAPAMAFMSLAHHIDINFLHAAYAMTRKDGAVGLDGQTAAEYAVGLEANLASLLDRFKSGQYKAPPARRVHIPKGDGLKTRPIGIPTFEDKVLQRAVAMVLESVYEQDFQDSSFGFRPGRSAHQALRAIRAKGMVMHGGWVIDLDIQGFFDALDHRHLRSFMDQRVRDGVLRCAIDKWLKAGVMEEGRLSRSKFGTPQGGVVSPLLANVYLHHVLDVWFEKEVKPRLRGACFLVRYADDVVIFMQHEVDAQRVMDVLPKRLGRFGLTMHPEKSRLVRFRQPKPAWLSGHDDDDSKPSGTFDFLGFTHYWGETRKGGWAMKQVYQWLVPRESSPVDCISAQDAGVETAGALRLLRHHGERLEPDNVLFSRRSHLAEVAEPSISKEVDAVEAVSPRPQAVPSSANDGNPLLHACVANPFIEEPDAIELARPDLRGAGEGDLPGLPDRSRMR